MKKLSKKSWELNKYFFLILLFLFGVCSSEFYSQENENNLISKTDSVFRFQGIIPPVEFQYDLDKFFTNPVSQLTSEILYDDNPATIWLRTELSISNQYSQLGEQRVENHFTSTLYKQYMKDSEFDIFRYVLGMAQASAVAYMAYRHVKKYGFWK